MNERKTVMRQINKLLQLGVISILFLGGFFVLGGVASAHDNIVSGVAQCRGTEGYTITWTVANDWNLNETVTVRAVTGGLPTLSATKFDIAASGNGSGSSGTQPYKSVKLQQFLPRSFKGEIHLAVIGTFSDKYSVTNDGFAVLPTNCVLPPPTTTTTRPVPPVTTTTIKTPVTTTTVKSRPTTTTTKPTTTTTVKPHKTKCDCVVVITKCKCPTGTDELPWLLVAGLGGLGLGVVAGSARRRYTNRK